MADTTILQKTDEKHGGGNMFHRERDVSNICERHSGIYVHCMDIYLAITLSLLPISLIPSPLSPSHPSAHFLKLYTSGIYCNYSLMSESSWKEVSI
jgi:hypothetical protein